MRNIILFMGGPGSGKSTQAKLICQKRADCVHISAGDLVRDIIKEASNPLAKDCQGYMEKGELLPDNLIKEILSTHIATLDKEKTILLDGYLRTIEQWEAFQKEFGQPQAVIHLDLSEEEMKNRLLHREENRLDDKSDVISKRISHFASETLPLIRLLKNTCKVITLESKGSINDVHQTLLLRFIPTIENVQDISVFHFAKLYWQTHSIYDVCDLLEKSCSAINYTISLCGKRFATVLQSHDAVKCILNARSKFGTIYHQFSKAAELKYDFVATDMGNGKIRFENGEVNFWHLAHYGFKQASKEDQDNIPKLINKHFYQFISEKTFDLDLNFDKFFNSFWCDYMFGDAVSPADYVKTRDQILSVMRFAFYQNRFKGVDYYNLSSPFWSLFKKHELSAAKASIKSYIAKTKTGWVARFREYLVQKNKEQALGLSEQDLNHILLDNVFDLFFEPDFLHGVIYESLVEILKNKVDIRNKLELDKAYQKGLGQAYLFPFRTRILEEAITLPDGTVLPAQSLVFINLKKSGWYHSAGMRSCVGQSFAHYFKNAFFEKLKNLEFKVKHVSEPQERKQRANDKDVPISAQRYRVSWRFKRDSLQSTVPYHDFYGKRFYDVLAINEDADKIRLIVDQFAHKITKMMETNLISKENLIVVAPELRGVPVASMVANKLGLPIYILRKEGGYKMDADQVLRQFYAKGYGKTDALEIPLNKKESLKNKVAVLIDDGVASGGSAQACCQLLEQLNVPVKLILAMIKHKYAQTNAALFTPYKKVKTLFDFENLPVEKTQNISCSAQGQKLSDSNAPSLCH